MNTVQDRKKSVSDNNFVFKGKKYTTKNAKLIAKVNTAKFKDILCKLDSFVVINAKTVKNGMFAIIAESRVKFFEDNNCITENTIKATLILATVKVSIPL